MRSRREATRGSATGSRDGCERFYEISGLGWSGHGKVVQVDVSADEGRHGLRALASA